MMDRALECRDLRVRHEPAMPPTLDGVSFVVNAGERVAVAGLNGAGKTTLLMSVVGLVPHSGEIWVCGTRLTRRSVSEARDRVGFLFNVPEDQLLFPRVVEDVAFGLLRRGWPSRDAFAMAGQWLDKLGVGHLARAPLHHLSHGQKQRVALAGALVTSPPLLLLDEPTAGLDPPGRRDLARLLIELESAMLVATHDLDFVDQTCSRVLLLSEGRIALEDRDAGAVRRCWTAGENR